MTSTTRPGGTPNQDADDKSSGEALGSRRGSIADLLGMPGIEDIELDIPPRKVLGRAADLS